MSVTSELDKILTQADEAEKARREEEARTLFAQAVKLCAKSNANTSQVSKTTDILNPYEHAAFRKEISGYLGAIVQHAINSRVKSKNGGKTLVVYGAEEQAKQADSIVRHVVKQLEIHEKYMQEKGVPGFSRGAHALGFLQKRLKRVHTML